MINKTKEKTIKIGDDLYGNICFYRVKLRVSNETTKTIWARSRTEAGLKITYVECDKEGGEIWKGNIKQIRIYIGYKDDIVWEKKARVNLRYGWLEVVEK